MICAWIETSSALIGSSQTMNVGLHGQGPGDADALALAAAELVRVAVGVVRVQAHQPQQLADALHLRPCPLASLWMSQRLAR